MVLLYTVYKELITKNDRNTLDSALNLNIVNTSSLNLVTTFTSFGHPKERLFMIVLLRTTSSLFSNYFPRSRLPDRLINVITIPPKLFWNKAVNEYKPVIYDGVDEDLCVFKYTGTSMTRSFKWTYRHRYCLIFCDETISTPELLRDFRIGKEVDNSTYHSIFFILKSNWGSFVSEDFFVLFLISNFVLT